MNKKQKAASVASLLEARYPDAACGLEANENPYRLLVMAILSAQCTDARVNQISPALFARFPDPSSLASAEIPEIEDYIRTCGLYHAKAKNLSLCAKRLCEVYGGVIPHEMDDLLSLAGVGRKVANLIRGDAFGLGGIVADTHCIRITNLLGLASSSDPHKVERTLDPLIPKNEQSAFCHRLVRFGRDVCIARRPKCEECELRELCKHYKG